jgi:hypothetical protein
VTASARGDDVGSFVDARHLFDAAMHAQDPVERQAQFEKAAELYERALRAAPERDEAPEAAINGAYAYRQIGQYRRAMSLYEILVAEYGSEAWLSKLATDPRRRAERLKYLYEAEQQLGSAALAVFDYAAAAKWFDVIAKDERLDAAKRRDAAKNAVALHAARRDRAAMNSAFAVASKIITAKDALASTAYVVANYDIGAWSASVPDAGDNRKARLAAEKSLVAFYDTYATTKGAEGVVFHAACSVANFKRDALAPDARAWLDRAKRAYDALERTTPAETRVGSLTYYYATTCISSTAPAPTSPLALARPPLGAPSPTVEPP